MDENIANFTAITSADPERAQQYLTLTENNLEQAIQLYFDSDGADMGASMPQQPAQQSQPTTRSSGPAYREDDDGVVTIDSDDEIETRGGHQPAAYEDDEAIARRMQEEMYGQGGGEEEVRAPMARTTETLVGGPGGYYQGEPEGNMQAAIAEQMMARQRRG